MEKYGSDKQDFIEFRANHELARLEKQHEENTLNLRCRLKRNDAEINALTLTIQGKDNQIDDLNKLCKPAHD